MAEGEKNAEVDLDRSSRSTRGKRLSKLLDDEIDADEEFWGQEAFQEAAEDDEYEAEEDVVDEFDSDFDEDVANVEDEDAPEEEVERVKRKKLLPPGSKPSRKEKRNVASPKTKSLDVIEAAVAAAVLAKDDEPTVSQLPKPIEEGTDTVESYADMEGEKIVRKSTRTAVVIRQAEREALRAAMQATTIKPVKKKREGERRITQEDMLLEAAQTEILNQQHLERMLAREEEVKQKAIVHKSEYDGPKLRFYSRDGQNLLEFIDDVSDWQDLFGHSQYIPKRPQLCAVTGLPAKYLDPLTGLPYATVEAFKMIRARSAEGNITHSIRTPWKNFRSPRSGFGRATVRRARNLQSLHHRDAHGKSSSAKSMAVGNKPKLNEESQEPYFLEKSTTNGPLTGLNTRLSAYGDSAIESEQIGAVSESVPGNRSVEKWLQMDGDSNMLPTTYENQSGPLWVEIPPPKEGPSEDTYFLEDLTSLDLGPILAAQHDFTCQPQRYDIDIDVPSCEGTFLPLDVLPMPQEFNSIIQL